jgi:hypothetical protein
VLNGKARRLPGFDSRIEGAWMQELQRRFTELNREALHTDPIRP